MFEESFRGDSRLFLGSIKSISLVFQECLKNNLRTFQVCLKGVGKKVSNVIPWCFIEAS